MNRTEAVGIAKESITRVILDADTGIRIDDVDTPLLATLSASADFLVARTK